MEKLCSVEIEFYGQFGKDGFKSLVGSLHLT